VVGNTRSTFTLGLEKQEFGFNIEKGMSDWELGAQPHRKSMRRWISQIRIFLNPELSAQQIPSAFSRGVNTSRQDLCKGSKSENKFIRSRAQRPVDSRGFSG
jgi:hypothetical protein